jgi:hypothetical protein
MDPNELARLIDEAYKRGWSDAARSLNDSETFHAWIGVGDREDLYGLLPGQRRAAAVYINSNIPAKAPLVPQDAS